MSHHVAPFGFVSAILLMGLAMPETRAQLVAYDGFGNGPKADLAGSNAGTGWSSTWANASSDPTAIAVSGLSYPGLATTAGSAVTAPGGGVWPSSIYARSFSAVPAGTTSIYVSFLLRDDAAWGSWGGLSFGQYPNKMTVGSPLGYYSYGLMMSQGLGDVSNKPLVQGETTLVVVKISRNPAGPGVTYRMYLDPTIGTAEPSFPAAQYTLSTVTGLPGYLSIDNGTGFTTDEIRVGTSWSAVLPAAVNPWTDLGFAKPGVTGAPHLTGVGSLTPNTACTLTLSNAKANTAVVLFLGTNASNTPFLGGVLVPTPSLAFSLGTNSVGTTTLTSNWPAGIPAGSALYFQYWIQDPAATLGVSASNGLRGIAH